ncbi:hypothetical protein [Sulfurisphaera ohwakuensis]|uniref:hypothetical protein n=1 Tax=Sulfurisphaera ohwakuensis TaxID=69656 RepID=UPI0036F383DB
MRVEGKISQNNEILLDGSICKGDKIFQTRFKIDTGFVGYDIAIPANIASELGLRPSKVETFSTVIGSERFYVGNDAVLCLGSNSYTVSYVIHYSKFPLISVNFLKNIAEVIIVDFINNLVIVILK